MCENCELGPFFDHRLAAYYGYEEALKKDIAFGASLGWKVEDLRYGFIRFSNDIYCGYATPATIRKELEQVQRTQDRLQLFRQNTIENFHLYVRRFYPLRMWKVLYGTIRSYHVSFQFVLDSHSLILSLGDETLQYPMTGTGMSKAASDIEYYFAHPTD